MLSTFSSNLEFRQECIVASDADTRRVEEHPMDLQR
jgi:hypothetical protein